MTRSTCAKRNLTMLSRFTSISPVISSSWEFIGETTRFEKRDVQSRMVCRRCHTGILLLAPLYVCLVFIGFFTFIFSRTPRPDISKQINNQDLDPNKPVTEPLQNATFNSTITPGVLNLHVWKDLCGLDVDRLRETPLFPLHPHQRLFLRRFQITQNVDNYGQRIFGFIRPKVSGLYTFAIASDDTSELWLSFDEKPSNLRLIASVFSSTSSAWTDDGVFSKYPSQQSRNIRLIARKKYFVEALHKQDKGNGHLKVFWRRPGSLRLESITSEYLQSYFDDGNLNRSGFVTPENLEALSSTPSHVKQREYKGLDLIAQFNYSSLPIIDTLSGILPSCAYKPSYIIKRNLSRYEGVDLVHDSAVFPDDNTNLREAFVPRSKRNKEVANETVNYVVEKFMTSLQNFYR